MSVGERHATPELLKTLTRQGLASGHFLRLLAHLRHLCPECGRAVAQFFARLDVAEEVVQSVQPLPPSVDPSRRDGTRPLRDREAQLAADLLVRMESSGRYALLGAGLPAAGLALLGAWMERAGQALGSDDGEGERRAYFAISLAERLDAERLPESITIDLLVDGWLALAQDALSRGLPERAAPRLRIAGLLADGGSGDAQQAGYLEMLQGLLASQQGEPELGVRRLGRAAEIGREIGADRLTGGSLLLQGQILELLGQHEAAAASLAEGLRMVPPEEDSDLVASAIATLRRLRGGAREAESEPAPAPTEEAVH